MSAPAIVIRIEFEAAPRVHACWLHEDDGIRLREWLDHHPEHAELIERALELERREQAA